MGIPVRKVGASELPASGRASKRRPLSTSPATARPIAARTSCQSPLWSTPSIQLCSLWPARIASISQAPRTDVETREFPGQRLDQIRRNFLGMRQQDVLRRLRHCCLRAVIELPRQHPLHFRRCIILAVVRTRVQHERLAGITDEQIACLLRCDDVIARIPGPRPRMRREERHQPLFAAGCGRRTQLGAFGNGGAAVRLGKQPDDREPAPQKPWHP